MTAAPLHALKQLILDKTQGTPFFMEEIVQELWSKGYWCAMRRGRACPAHGGRNATLHIPTTVQGVLAARIDRLAPDEKDSPATARGHWSRVPVSLIRQVIPPSLKTNCIASLSSLQHKEFLYEQPAFPEVEYIFKHALTQEVAYNSVLQERRKALHEQTAQAIEALYHPLEDHYSELAHHYSRSGNTAKAVEYLSLAGQQAAQQSANAEAINHLTAALELLKTLPDTTARARQELTLQLSLGASLMATKGYGPPKWNTPTPGRRSCVCRWGSRSRSRQSCVGCGHLMQCEGITQRRSPWGNSSSPSPTDSRMPPCPSWPMQCWGQHCSGCGEFALAQAHLEQAVAFYDPEHHRDLAYHMGQDLGLVALGYAAETLWYCGYPDQALERAIRHFP